MGLRSIKESHDNVCLYSNIPYGSKVMCLVSAELGLQ